MLAKNNNDENCSQYNDDVILQVTHFSFFSFFFSSNYSVSLLSPSLTDAESKYRIIKRKEKEQSDGGVLIVLACICIYFKSKRHYL